MNLEEAIKWAEKIGNKFLVYYVRPWNEGYCVMNGNEIKRNPNTKTVYNTKDKVIDYKFTDMYDSFSTNNRHVRVKVLRNHIHTPNKIASSFICIKEHVGGPKVGTIIKPFYIKEDEWVYKFKHNNLESQFSASRMDRMGVYYKDCNEVEEDQKKKPKVRNKKTRLNNLLTQKIK